MKKHTYKLGSLIIGLLFAFSLQAQERTEEVIIKEVEAFEAYKEQLDRFMNSQAKGKGVKSIYAIPKPDGVDPCISEGGNGNVRSWELYRKTKGNMMAEIKSASDASSSPMLVKERNNATIDNDTNEIQAISNFGTGVNQVRNIKIEGISNVLPTEFTEIQEEEDNHALSIATGVDLIADETIQINGSLRNIEKRERLSGDLDVYEFAVQQGALYFIDIENEGEEDVLFQQLLHSGDDDSFINRRTFTNATRLRYVVQEGQRSLKLSLLDARSFSTINPTNVDAVYNVGVETTYSIRITEITEPDVDTYKLALKEGDVIGVTGTSELQNMISLESVDGVSLIRTGSYGIFPNSFDSPLPTNGSFGFHYVVPKTGEYLLRTSNGIGSYVLDCGISRPGLEERNQGLGQQIVFINYSGIEIGFDEFREEESENDFAQEFLPLQSYMQDFGLKEFNTIRLSQKITQVIRKKLEATSSLLGTDTGITILSDHASTRRRDAIRNFLDEAAIPYSTLIIGGAGEGFFLGGGPNRVNGLASAIDVGNFDLSNNAFVLLNSLSADASNRNSINRIPLAEGAEKIDLVAEVVGTIGAHEVGHFLGNWHTDGGNETIGIMDEGGSSYIGNRAGVIEGDAFGDAQNIAVNFVKDTYSTRESTFVGLDETDVNTAYALFNGSSTTSKSIDPLTTFMRKLDDFSVSAAIASVKSYPNPQKVSETATLIVNSDIDSTLSIGLFDMQGRKISEIYNGNIKDGEPMQLNFNPTTYNLGRGVYFYKITSDNGQKSHRIVVD